MGKLKYNKEYYTVSAHYGFHPLNRKQMETEYDRLRKIANRSLERIATSEFANQQFYKEFYGKFDIAGHELSERDLTFLLQDVAYYVSNARSTYTGAREARRRAVRTMKQHGYGFITYKNIDAFGQFMEQVKTAYGDRLYDSNRVVEFFEEHKSGNVSSEELLKDFNTWMVENAKL